MFQSQPHLVDVLLENYLEGRPFKVVGTKQGLAGSGAILTMAIVLIGHVTAYFIDGSTLGLY